MSFMGAMIVLIVVMYVHFVVTFFWMRLTQWWLSLVHEIIITITVGVIDLASTLSMQVLALAYI